MATQPYAVFDIDGTLIRWQLFHAIVHQLGKHGYLPQKDHQAIRAARMQWKNRNNDESYKHYESTLIHSYEAALHQTPIGAYTAAIDEVFEEYKDQLFVYTRELLTSLKQQGYLLFAISGSHDEIVQKLAKYHGFDAAIGAEIVIKDGAFTGEIKTPIHNKYAALKTLLSQYQTHQNGSIGVGDTASDIAVLEHVDQPIAFNPERSLYTTAKERGWQIVVERKNVIYKIAKEAM